MTQRKNVLAAFADFCTGCRTCEIVCSLKHTGTANPALARLKLVHSRKDHSTFPIICRHCKNAPCQAACPVPGAMHTDPKTAAVIINEEKCIQCLACVEACPFAAIQVGPAREILKCDLCGGNPLCAEYCPPVGHLYPHMPRPAQSCLQFVEASRVTKNKRQSVARKA
ncbi:MAG: 4Fe-4S dicluster domain-containing protein [Dehalococcoidia bacterium]|nr:4Fe-4S dicluster domain-containing protein [Dehalococcoidia bacterium]